MRLGAQLAQWVDRLLGRSLDDLNKLVNQFYADCYREGYADGLEEGKRLGWEECRRLYEDS